MIPASLASPATLSDPSSSLSNLQLANRLQRQKLADEPSPAAQGSTRLRDAFDQFVGQTFYSEMLKALRKTTDKPAYFHGGRGEEVFQGQLDQLLSERLTESTAHQFTGPMFELFTLPRP